MASKSTAISLRSHTDIYLIGQPCMSILGTKLPSVGQVLRLFFFCIRDRGMEHDEGAYLTADAAMIFWRQAFIPTQDKSVVKKKIISLHGKWRALQRNMKRGGKTQKSNEESFTEELDELFDIAHADAFKMIKNPVDAEFLRLQRMKGRPGCMAGVDEAEFSVQKRRAERDTQDEARKQRSKFDTETTAEGALLLHV